MSVQTHHACHSVEQTLPRRPIRTGLGLFATKPIKKGARIVRYFGPLLDSRKEKDDAIENKYLFELNNRWTIDGSVRTNIARYINHACRPNAGDPTSSRASARSSFARSRTSRPGDEINYDYGTDYFKEYIKLIGCKCVACKKSTRISAPRRGLKKARLKAKAERKALKQAAKQAPKADKKKPSKSARATASKLLNGHGAKSAASRTAKSGISVKARGKSREQSRAST